MTLFLHDKTPSQARQDRHLDKPQLGLCKRGQRKRRPHDNNVTLS